MNGAAAAKWPLRFWGATDFRRRTTVPAACPWEKGLAPRPGAIATPAGQSEGECFLWPPAGGPTTSRTSASSARKAMAPSRRPTSWRAGTSGTIGAPNVTFVLTDVDALGSARQEPPGAFYVHGHQRPSAPGRHPGGSGAVRLTPTVGATPAFREDQKVPTVRQ